MGKWRVLAFARLHPCFGGGGGDGGLLFHFILSKIAILDKIDGKFVTPLPPKSRIGKWRVLAFARLHPCFGGGGDGGLLFHFILSKIVGPHRVTLAFPSKQQTIVVTRVGKDIVQIWDRFLYFAAGLASCLGLYWCCRYLSLTTVAQLSCASHPHLSASLKK